MLVYLHSEDILRTPCDPVVVVVVVPLKPDEKVDVSVWVAFGNWGEGRLIRAVVTAPLVELDLLTATTLEDAV